MNWKDTDTTKMSETYLRNTSAWIKRKLEESLPSIKDRYVETYQLALSVFRKSQIACIQAEIVFRKHNIDDRLIYDDLNKDANMLFGAILKQESKFRVGNWVTPTEVFQSMKQRSDEKFEDNYGFHPDDFGSMEDDNDINLF